MTATGYSGTPLAKKLGIKAGCRMRIVNPPANYFELFADFPEDILVIKDKSISKNLVHYFTKDSAGLKQDIADLKKEIYPGGCLWISWPKKAAKMKTDLTEDVIRNIALGNGLLDVKVCAVDETWSGLKLVIPLKDRKNNPKP